MHGRAYSRDQLPAEGMATNLIPSTESSSSNAILLVKKAINYSSRKMKQVPKEDATSHVPATVRSMQSESRRSGNERKGKRNVEIQKNDARPASCGNGNWLPNNERTESGTGSLYPPVFYSLPRCRADMCYIRLLCSFLVYIYPKLDEKGSLHLRN